jgi:hypothetical protein
MQWSIRLRHQSRIPEDDTQVYGALAGWRLLVFHPPVSIAFNRNALSRTTNCVTEIMFSKQSRP